MPLNLPLIALGVFCFILAWVFLRLDRTLSSPAVIFHSIWAIVLFIGGLPVINFNQINNQTIFVIFFAHLAFAVSYFPMSYFWRKRDHYRLRRLNRVENVAAPVPSVDVEMQQLRILLRPMILLGTFGTVLLWVYLSSYYGGIQALFQNSQILRSRMMSGDISVPLYLTFFRVFTYASTPLCAYYLVKTWHWRSFWLYLPLVNAFLESSVSFGRTLFLWNTLLFISALLIVVLSDRPAFRMGRLRISPMRITLIGGMLLTMVWLGSDFVRQLRGNFDDFSHTVAVISPYSNLPVGKSYLLNSLVANYANVVGPIFALDQIVLNSDQYYYGTASFESVIDLVSKITGQDIFNKRINRYQFTYIPWAFNVHTFLREPYEDGGIIGVIIYLYAIGLSSAFIYRRWRIRRTISWFITLAFLLVFLEYGIFVNLFAAASLFWMSYLLGLVVALFTQRANFVKQSAKGTIAHGFNFRKYNA